MITDLGELLMQVLGIAGSARDGNTKILVETALNECSKFEGIKTKFISLHDKEINPCDGCEKCHENGGTCIIEDDLLPILDDMVNSDAIIIGSPAYIHGVSSYIKILMDRTNSLFNMETGGSKLKNKIGASISVGQLRQGGQAYIIQTINNFFFAHAMIVIAGEVDESYPGVTAWTNYETDADSVLKDNKAIEAAENLGNRVSSLLKLINKNGS